jgi:hypothetical protein
MNPNEKVQQDQSGKRRDQKRQGATQIPGEVDGNIQPDRDRDQANDRKRRGDRQPDDKQQAIPDLDEPDVEGVGEEGRDTPGGSRRTNDR